ncbi:hypothetical protein A3D83_00010 [Candidatus Daviesbacteria bacterium RIFCSPHIGHO2_02_FULL_41_10]|uniref:Uncharacterized protein n=3 Tax=Patescibacteria group TaxID=1783273 RepID=A0A1F5IRX4_9BACT|nr:MAG: hypothetical protein A2871_01810 [Candidatus Daviesbacteria bacterium RIFCSPHIGHO2_01_FULL_41_23]OGE33711.1 MAG: hypothetical protein A3D83_00010 [Candidatus Daviesbacteria bacterium RIFCSPHIGHO2_02_FULL_41_10]OGE62199.1 MAG: hypothetical protein A2967_00905 [Candidatus Daviesbacteria bacterium RIFCSPLOWO2_01_FULL_41_32]OGZ38774.1 MAG: hypothetical protein A3E90_02350 [Candidatus Portnoybacteria bacterium RIFCSPHIGHO2_12_FULL_40_11]
MIQIIIIRKVLLYLVPLILFYLLRKMGKREQSKRKSHLFDFDKEKIVEGEIVDENSSNR